jgi:hypothetical protein
LTIATIIGSRTEVQVRMSPTSSPTIADILSRQ